MASTDSSLELSGLVMPPTTSKDIASLFTQIEADLVSLSQSTDNTAVKTLVVTLVSEITVLVPLFYTKPKQYKRFLTIVQRVVSKHGAPVVLSRQLIAGIANISSTTLLTQLYQIGFIATIIRALLGKNLLTDDLFIDEPIVAEKIANMISTFYKSNATSPIRMGKSMMRSTGLILLSSKTLVDAYLKIAKPLGKTVKDILNIQIVPYIKSVTSAISLCRSLVPQTVMATSYPCNQGWNAIKPAISQWFVAEIINTTLKPRPDTMAAFTPFLNIAQPEDLTLPSGVVSDLYNPDIIQSIIKSIRIRPSISIPALSTILTQIPADTCNTYLPLLLAPMANEIKAADASRSTIALDLWTHIVNNIQLTNDNDKLIISLFIDILNGSADHTPMTTVIIKQHMIDMIYIFVTRTIIHINPFNMNEASQRIELWTPLLHSLCNFALKDGSVDIKVKIIALITNELLVTQLSSLEVLPDVCVQLFSSIITSGPALAATQLDAIIALYEPVISTIVNSMISPLRYTQPELELIEIPLDKETSPSLYTKIDPYQIKYYMPLLTHINDTPVLKQRLYEYIQFSSSRPILQHSLLSTALLLLFVHNYTVITTPENMNQPINDIILSLFTSDSPLNTMSFQIDPTASTNKTATTFATSPLRLRYAYHSLTMHHIFEQVMLVGPNVSSSIYNTYNDLSSSQILTNIFTSSTCNKSMNKYSGLISCYLRVILTTNHLPTHSFILTSLSSYILTLQHITPMIQHIYNNILTSISIALLTLINTTHNNTDTLLQTLHYTKQYPIWPVSCEHITNQRVSSPRPPAHIYYDLENDMPPSLSHTSDFWVQTGTASTPLPIDTNATTNNDNDSNTISSIPVDNVILGSMITHLLRTIALSTYYNHNEPSTALPILVSSLLSTHPISKHGYHIDIFSEQTVSTPAIEASSSLITLTHSNPSMLLLTVPATQIIIPYSNITTLDVYLNSISLIFASLITKHGEAKVGHIFRHTDSIHFIRTITLTGTNPWISHITSTNVDQSENAIDITTITRANIKQDNAYKPIDPIYYHTVGIFFSFYSIHYPTVFHTHFMSALQERYMTLFTGIMSSMTLYLNSVYNTPSGQLCTVDDDDKYSTAVVTSPTTVAAKAPAASKSTGKDAKKPATTAASPKEDKDAAKLASQIIIRKNYAILQQYIASIITIYDYIVHLSVVYSRDELLGSIFNNISIALYGDVQTWQNKHGIVTNIHNNDSGIYVEKYRTNIFVPCVLPLMFSFVFIYDQQLTIGDDRGNSTIAVPDTISPTTTSSSNTSKQQLTTRQLLLLGNSQLYNISNPTLPLHYHYINAIQHIYTPNNSLDLNDNDKYQQKVYFMIQLSILYSNLISTYYGAEITLYNASTFISLLPTIQYIILHIKTMIAGINTDASRLTWPIPPPVPENTDDSTTPDDGDDDDDDDDLDTTTEDGKSNIISFLSRLHNTSRKVINATLQQQVQRNGINTINSYGQNIYTPQGTNWNTFGPSIHNASITSTSLSPQLRNNFINKTNIDNICISSLYIITQLISMHANVISSQVQPYPLYDIFNIGITILNTLGTHDINKTTLIHLPSSSPFFIQNDILEPLSIAMIRIGTALPLDLFKEFILSDNGLYSSSVIARLTAVQICSKTPLIGSLMTLCSTQPPTVEYTSFFLDLYIALSSLCYDTTSPSSNISTYASSILTTHNILGCYIQSLGYKLGLPSNSIDTVTYDTLPNVLLTSEHHDTTSIVKLQDIITKLITSYISLLTHHNKSIRHCSGTALVTLLDHYPNSLLDIMTQIQELYLTQSDYTIKKSTGINVRNNNTSTFISLASYRITLLETVRQLALVLKAKDPSTLINVMTFIIQRGLAEDDYDVWDIATKAGSSIIHYYSNDKHILDTLTYFIEQQLVALAQVHYKQVMNNLIEYHTPSGKGAKNKKAAVTTEPDTSPNATNPLLTTPIDDKIILPALATLRPGQKRNLYQGLIMLISHLSHYYTHDKSKIMYTTSLLINACHTTRLSSIHNNIITTLVPLCRTISYDNILKLYDSQFTMLSAHNIDIQQTAAINCVAIIKSIGSKIIRDRSILVTLSSWLQGKDVHGIDLPNKMSITNHLRGSLQMYYYLFINLPQQMCVEISRILPLILPHFSSDTTTFYLVEDLARAIMRTAGQLPNGSSLVLPLLLVGLKDRHWQTRASTLNLVSAVVSFSLRDLSYALPEIMPYILELRNDPNTEVSSGSNRIIQLLGRVVVNPEVKKISQALVNALVSSSTATSATTHQVLLTALNQLHTTVFQHYVDPISLSLIIPVVTSGLRMPGIDVNTKQIALQLAGSVAMLTLHHSDLAPYLTLLLSLMKGSLMDSLPNIRNVTAKAIYTMITTTRDQNNLPPAAMTNTDGTLIPLSPPPTLSTFINDKDQFDILLLLLLDVLSQKHVKIPQSGDVSLYADNGTSTVHRSGASLGAANIIFTKGIYALEYFYEVYILPQLASNIPTVREGYLTLLHSLITVYGKEFGPLVVKALPVTMGNLNDQNSGVREFAQKASQAMVSRFAQTYTHELLATVLEALGDRDPRIRTGSIILAACYLLKLAGVDGDISIAEAEDAVSQLSVQTQIRERVAITNEGQENLILEYISTTSRDELYSSLFLLRTDPVSSVSMVAWRIWKALVPSTTRTLAIILPRLIQRITSDLASFSEFRQATAAKALSELVVKLGDRILRDVVPLILEQTEIPSQDVFTRSGLMLGISNIFASATKSMMSPYIVDIFPVIRIALGDKHEIVRDSAKEAFYTMSRCLGAERAVSEIIPELLNTIDTLHNEYRTQYDNGITHTSDGDLIEDLSIYYIQGLRNIVTLSHTQRLILDCTVPYLIKSPITHHHISVLSSVTAVCGRVFNIYLDRVMASLYNALYPLFLDLYDSYNTYDPLHQYVYSNNITITTPDMDLSQVNILPTSPYQPSWLDENDMTIELQHKYNQYILDKTLLSNNALNLFEGLIYSNPVDILQPLLNGLADVSSRRYPGGTDSIQKMVWLHLLSLYFTALYNIDHDDNSIDLDETYGVTFTHLITVLCSQWNDDSEHVLVYTCNALSSLLNCKHYDYILRYLPLIRAQISSITGKKSKKSSSSTRAITQLPAFDNYYQCTIPNPFISTLLSLCQHILVSAVSQPLIRTQSAHCIADITELTPSTSLDSHAMKLTGFLIRTFVDRLSIDIKGAVLTALRHLIMKCGNVIRPFHPQLRATLVKTIMYVDPDLEKGTKAIISATGKEVASATNDINNVINTIQGSDTILYKASLALSVLQKPETFINDLFKSAILHSTRYISSKILHCIYTILSQPDIASLICETSCIVPSGSSNATTSASKFNLYATIDSQLELFINSTIHESYVTELARLIGICVNILPYDQSIILVGKTMAYGGITLPCIIESHPDIVELATIHTSPIPITRKAIALVLTSILVNARDQFIHIIGYKPAVQFIARGFNDDDDAPAKASIILAGRLLLYALTHEDSQITVVLTRELLKLGQNDNMSEQRRLSALSQIVIFARDSPETIAEMQQHVIPICVRARHGATKLLRNTIDIILYYTLLFNRDESTGLDNAIEFSTQFGSNDDAQQFIDLCKRSVVGIYKDEKKILSALGLASNDNADSIINTTSNNNE